MAALTQNRNTREVYCNAPALHRVKTPAANTTLYLGGICAVNSAGNAVPASDTAGLIVLGRTETVMPDGRVLAKTGVFLYDNGTGNEALAATEINRIVYVLDDHTVGKIGGTNQIAAGVLRDIDASGALLVEVGTLTLTPPAAE